MYVKNNIMGKENIMETVLVRQHLWQHYGREPTQIPHVIQKREGKVWRYSTPFEDNILMA